MPDFCVVKKCRHVTSSCCLRVIPSRPIHLRVRWHYEIRKENGKEFKFKAYHRLCDCHFTDEQFHTNELANGKLLKRLKPDAWPDNISGGGKCIPKEQLMLRSNKKMKIAKNATSTGIFQASTSFATAPPAVMTSFQSLAPKPEIMFSPGTHLLQPTGTPLLTPGTSLVTLPLGSTLTKPSPLFIHSEYENILQSNAAALPTVSANSITIPSSQQTTGIIVQNSSNEMHFHANVQAPMGFLIPVKALGNNIFEPIPPGKQNKTPVPTPMKIISSRPALPNFVMPPAVPPSSKQCDDNPVLTVEDEDFLPLSDTDEHLEEFDEDAIMPPINELCRLCAEAQTFGGESMLDIFSEESQYRNIPDLIKQYLPIEVSDTDRLPLKICVSCINALQACHEMVLKCRRAESTLQRLLERDEEREASPIPCVDDICESIFQEEENVLPSVPVNDPETDPPYLKCGMKNCTELSRTRRALLNHYYAFHKRHACSTCWMSFKNSKKLRAHIYDIHAEWHLCDMCGVSVKGKGGLRLHMAKHIPSSERRFKCDLCDAAYTRPYLLQKHKTRHAEQKSFECQTCGKKFFDAQDLRIHNSIHAEKDTYKCKQCRQTFSCKRYLAVHVARYHVENWKLHCKLCNFKVNTLKDIKDHIQESHEDATQFIGEYFDITSPFCCETCSKYFPNKATHIDHINKFRGTCANRVRVMKNIVACEVCGQIFLSKIKLVHHRKNVHGIIPSKVLDSMDCELCKKKFASKYLLQSHMNVHRDVNKPFKCQYCIARFATAEFHLDHERIHRGETPFACDVCNKKFPSKKCLWRHYKAHTKPFQCHECGKRFSRKKNWETHQRVHTNERPYGCKYCNRTFKQKTEMEFHQLLHTKEKKFKCGICGFADNKLKVMREHMAINHTEVDDIEDSIVKHDFT